MMKPATFLLLSLIGLIGCEQSEPDSMSDNSIKIAIEQAVANPGRPQEDRDRDDGRRPAEVLNFCGITAGMTVLEFQAGTGYYAEILSYIVGQNEGVNQTV